MSGRLTCWFGWKFLVTSKHVIGDLPEIIMRGNPNPKDQSKFVCRKIQLRREAPDQNVISGDSGVDLVAILLPDAVGSDFIVMPAETLMDEKRMQELSIGVGTEVVTIGYLYGYSRLELLRFTGD
jgi:hypothetical protein